MQLFAVVLTYYYAWIPEASYPQRLNGPTNRNKYFMSNIVEKYSGG
jgi:hypothetical protein